MKKLIYLFSLAILFASPAFGACADTIKPAQSVVYFGTGSFLLSDAVSGGTWSSSNTAVAIVGASTGKITAVAKGPFTVTYIASHSCTYTKRMWVVDQSGPVIVLGAGAASYVTINNQDYKRTSIQVSYGFQQYDSTIAISNLFTGRLIIPTTADSNFIYRDSSYKRVVDKAALRTWLINNAY